MLLPSKNKNGLKHDRIEEKKVLILINFIFNPNFQILLYFLIHTFANNKLGSMNIFDLLAFLKDL